LQQCRTAATSLLCVKNETLLILVPIHRFVPISLIATCDLRDS